MADGAFVVREIFEILIALAIRRCRLSGSLCRLTVSLKCFRESETPSVRISISDTGVGSSLEEFRALEFGGHPSVSLDKWDGVLSITTTSINEKEIQHYRLNLREIVSSRMRLKRLPSTLKHVGTFSGTEVCFSTEEENIDEFVASVVKFVQKMHMLKNHETLVDLLVENIDNQGCKHVQYLPENRSSMATSRPITNIECLYYGLVDYKFQQRGSVELACGTRREDFKVGIGTASNSRNGRHAGCAVDVAVLVVPLGSIPCCLGASSQNTELLFFRDFSPFSTTQSTLNSLGRFKWQNYGLKLKGIVEREGHAVLEWEDLPLAHLDIAIHTYDTNILQERQEISDRKLVIDKALKSALNDLKAKYTGLFLSSRALKIQKHAPALSRTIACLITSSKDQEFQAECARLLGLEAASACNEMLELRIREKLTETIAMNDLKHKKEKDMAPDLFQCEPLNAENCLEEYGDENVSSLDL